MCGPLAPAGVPDCTCDPAEPLLTSPHSSSAVVTAVRNLAIQQAVYVPLGAMLALIAFAFTVPGYHPLSQHLSELGLMPGLPAKAVQVGAVVSGSARNSSGVRIEKMPMP